VRFLLVSPGGGWIRAGRGSGSTAAGLQSADEPASWRMQNCASIHPEARRRRRPQAGLPGAGLSCV